MKVAIIGHGHVGKAYHKMFPEAVIYDEPQIVGRFFPSESRQIASHIKAERTKVNDCDIALVCVPTDSKDGQLDMSIVEEVISWLDTPLILIKSALMPGTVDRLVKETGKKIAVSVEFIGEGKYKTHYWRYPHQNDPRLHQMLIVGGEQKTAEKCAEYLWDKMSPDIQIRIVSALEAEITKLVENSYGALKVTWINTLMSLAEKSNASFMNIHQAWKSDPRVDSMHMRTISWKRGWKSKCWDKDVPALASYAQAVGATDLQKLIETIIELNNNHLEGENNGNNVN